MGFGGGNGFSPSRTIVEDSTKTGNDAGQKHQFTGSVEISGGPLKLNGASITGGGGGTPGGSDTQFQYNNGGAFGGASGLIYDDANNRVGIGVADPETPLEIRSTTTQQRWSYDDDHEFTVSVADNGETVLAVSGTTTAGLGASDLVLDVSKGGDIFFRRSGDRLRFGISTGDTIIQTDNQNTDLAFRVHPDGGLGAIGTEIARFDASAAGAFLMSGTISVPGGDAPINFRDTATNIHSPGANRLALTAPKLEVTGALEVLSTSTQAKFSYDADSFATLTVADASEVTVATGESGNLILDAGGDIRLNAAGGDISFRENAEVKLIFDMDTAGGTTKIYSGVAGDDLIFGTAPGGAGNVLTIKDDGKVGLGLNDPDSTFEIFSATTQQKWSYDADSFATLTVADDSNTTLATGENGNITLHAGPAGDILLVADGGQVNLQNPIGTNKLSFDVENAGGLAFISNVKDNDLAFRVGTGVKEVFRIDQSEGALLMSGNVDNPGGLAPIHFRNSATKIHSPSDNVLTLTGPTVDVAGTFSLNSSNVTSTAPELNLLDASNGSPSAGAWGAVERIGVYTIAGAKAGSAIGGGGTNHTLGTLPAGAYVTEAYLDVTSVFAIAGGAVAISLGTATTYPAASRPFLEVCQPGAIPRTGGTIDATSVTGVITLSAGSGFSPALFPGAKLPAQENVILNVADGAGGTDGLTASGATLILKYIVM